MLVSGIVMPFAGPALSCAVCWVSAALLRSPSFWRPLVGVGALSVSLGRRARAGAGASRVDRRANARSAPRRRVKFLPMTSAATPVSAAAKQQHQNNYNKDHFHGKSP